LFYDRSAHLRQLNRKPFFWILITDHVVKILWGVSRHCPVKADKAEQGQYWSPDLARRFYFVCLRLRRTWSVVHTVPLVSHALREQINEVRIY
jgi:hypothetical protein